MSKEKYPKENEKFEQSIEMPEKKKTSEVPAEKKYRVVFKQNRSFDLHIGREILHFAPHGVNPVYPEAYRNGLPEKLVNHKDFKSAEKYFAVMEG